MTEEQLGLAMLHEARTVTMPEWRKRVPRDGAYITGPKAPVWMKTVDDLGRGPESTSHIAERKNIAVSTAKLHLRQAFEAGILIRERGAHGEFLYARKDL